MAIEGNKRLMRKTWKEKLRNKVSIEIWKALTHAKESKRPQTCIGLCVWSGKTWKGCKFLPLARFKALCQQEVKAVAQL